jgi:hypothetical protein
MLGSGLYIASLLAPLAHVKGVFGQVQGKDF